MTARAAMVICLLLAIAALHLSEFGPAAESKENGSFEIAIGQAQLPFQHRILSPLAALTIMRYTTAGYNRAASMIALLALMTMFAAIYREAGTRGLVIAFIALWPSLSVRYVYDLTHPLFMVGLTIAAMRRNAWAWFALFIVGTFNRETTLYLAPALGLIYWRREGLLRAVIMVSASCAAWVAIKALLSHWFGAPPIPFDLLAINYNYLLYGAGHPRILLFFALGGAWTLIPLAWKEMTFERRALLTSLPVAFACLLVFGNIWEIRIFGDLAPVVALALGSVENGRSK